MQAENILRRERRAPSIKSGGAGNNHLATLAQRSYQVARIAAFRLSEDSFGRAQLDKAFKTLKSSQNPHNLDGVDARGGTLANTRVAVVEGGKIKEMAIASFK